MKQQSDHCGTFWSLPGVNQNICGNIIDKNDFGIFVILVCNVKKAMR